MTSPLGCIRLAYQIGFGHCIALTVQCVQCTYPKKYTVFYYLHYFTASPACSQGEVRDANLGQLTQHKKLPNLQDEFRQTKTN